MVYCEDCGCRMSNGYCSNCHEEAYIMEFQGEYITEPLSEEFQQKAAEQREDIKKKLKECKRNG